MLAESLGKTVGEINRMDIREYMGWIEWFKIKSEKHGKN
jgi:hypothetical protein